MSKTTIEISIMDMSQFLARLASLQLWMKHKGLPDIAVSKAMWRLTEDNREVEAMWDEAQKQALQHHAVALPKIQALQAEFAGKRLVDDTPSMTQP